MLDQVTCRGAGSGYGTADGRTKIRVTAYFWTALRTNIARKLADLESKGCDVQVIYASDTVEAPVPKTLLAKKVPVYDSRIDVNGDRVPDLYVHSKYVLIDGVVGTDSRAKLVYTGSPNFTRNSLRESNEILLRIDRDDVYEKFAANFAEIRDHWTKRVITVPKATSQVAARNSGPESDPRAGDYALDPPEDE
jgi:phosphatidylserine/phosphatidylglycerophosphate/cardiolipin synthase-like enzyme